jgi:hypothetical protein
LQRRKITFDKYLEEKTSKNYKELMEEKKSYLDENKEKQCFSLFY